MVRRYTPEVATTSRGLDCLDDATIVAFLDGELGRERLAEVNAHVDRCASCLSLVAALGRVEGDEVREGSERYEIRGEVGSGGMGQVFLAFDTVLGREVALKCVRSGPEDRAAARRFEREMELTAQLQHPSIIPVYDAGLFPDGSRYFAMRLVEGRTLDAALGEATSFEQRMALVPSIRRACEAVAYAHERAVIHRDLKPANVLIGPFGETVVLDWGLAKHLGEDEADAESFHSDIDDEGMTRPGAVMGTRGYIAPEVARGEPADARSDVFSLGKVLQRLLVEVQGSREVVADLEAVIERATATDPASRYLDASGLCDDLQRFESGQTVSARDYSLRSRVRRFARAHRRAIVLSTSFVALGVLAGLAAASLGGAGGPEPCSGAEAALEGVWNDERREAGRRAFAAVGRPYADDAWARAEVELDGYASAWTSEHTEACRAHARGELSSELLDLRMGCLDRAAVSLGATTELFARADSGVARKADELADALPPLQWCSDPEVLRASVVPPQAEDAEAVETAREHLARAQSLGTAIRFEEAAKEIDAAREALAGTRYEPVRTELALAEGSLLCDRGDYAQAEEILAEAVRLGMKFGQREEVRRALVEMAAALRELGEARVALRSISVLEGLSQGSPSAQATFHSALANTLGRAGDWARAENEHQAALAIRRGMLEPDPQAIARSRKGLARAYQALGDPERAEAEMRAALRGLSEAKGPDHPETASVQTDLASLLDGLGKYEEAEVEARAAVGVLERSLSPDHPDTCVARNTLGNILFARGTLDEAEAEYRAVLACSTDGDGAANVRLAATANNLANLLFLQNRFEEAETEYRGALNLALSTIGAEHPTIALYRNSLANALASVGRFAEAGVEYRAALELQVATLPPGNPEIATTRTNLGNSLLAQERYDDALTEFREALGIYERGLGSDHPLVATVKSNIGHALLALDRAEEAETFAVDAWTLRSRGDASPSQRGTTAFLLARIHRRTGARAQSKAMAAEARKAFTEAGDASELEALDAWQAG